MTLKIAIAPNSFRGSLSAFEAATCIERGLHQSLLTCETILMPLADGGNGTLDVWLKARGGQTVNCEVMGPLGQPVMAEFGLLGDTALVEMARASGVELLTPEQRNPLNTTTYGTGQLIKNAIEHGAKTILVAVGGSATVDGGIGCLEALGAKLLDASGRWIQPPYGSGALSQLDTIDLSPVHQLLHGINIQVLCDVDNPLVGERGAAPVFGPQKGATPAIVEELAANLAHFAKIVQRDVGIDIANVPGAGAAGGLSGGLMAAGATLVSGVEALIQDCRYDKRLAQGDIGLVITGEGKLDEQTKGGKAPVGIAQEAAKYNIPVVAFAGAVTTSISELQQWGIQAAWSIVRQPATLETALQNAPEWLTEAAINLGNALYLGTKIEHSAE